VTEVHRIEAATHEANFHAAVPVDPCPRLQGRFLTQPIIDPIVNVINSSAPMVELVDPGDLKSPARKSVPVRRRTERPRGTEMGQPTGLSPQDFRASGTNPAPRPLCHSEG
jgi:hypothetical protein